MKIFILTIFSAFIIISCSGKIKEPKNIIGKVTQNKSSIDCIRKEDKENIINGIMASDDLQDYIKAILNRSLKVQILKSKFITEDLIIYTNEQKILLQDLGNNAEQIFKIDFFEMDCKVLKISFRIWYEFEHVNIAGYVIKKNNLWQVNITEHGIID